MKFLIFGTGDYYNRYKKWFAHEDVVALLDNSQQKQYTFMDKTEILPPKEGVKLSYDVIVILSFHVNQMKQQLISLGVAENRIFHFYDLNRLLGQNKRKWQIQYYLNAEKIVKSVNTSQKKILLLSNDLSLGGPSIALFYAAIVLKQQGYLVVYASMLDGTLRESLMERDIPVVVDENLQIATMAEVEWVNTFSLVVCNTLNFHVFLSERNTDIPILWWLHDSAYFYNGVKREIMKSICLENLQAVSVGPVPEAAIKEFLPDMECGRLLYGVEDIQTHSTDVELEGQDRVKHSSQVCFVTIGFLEERKGQDILLEAINQLPVSVREGCLFYIVGHNKTIFGQELYRKSANIREIIFTGSVGREKIHALLNRSDVLICPSRQDPMPTVAAEAMMHSVPCIVSNAIGTAAYIRDGENGFVFQNENAAALAGKIQQCVERKECIPSIGKKARKLYDQFFSMKSFEGNFLNIVNAILKSI